METIYVGLCALRHEMPVTEFIYPNSVDPTDFVGMKAVFDRFLLDRVGIHTETRLALNQRYDEDVPCYRGDKALVVYVTGLTACVATVIAECAKNGVALTLMHYDRESEEYIPQIMFK